MLTFLNTLPGWLFPLGWFALLVGWALGRPTTASIFNKITTIGFNNQVQNQVAISNAPATSKEGDSALSKAGSWASLVGLVLTLIPLLKDWLK